MSELSKKVGEMLDLREEFLASLNNALPNIKGHIHLAAIDDRREFWWRLSDDDKSLVYGESKSDVVEMTDNTFVDEVHNVWRPYGEDFIVVYCNTGLGDESVIAILDVKMELVKT